MPKKIILTRRASEVRMSFGRSVAFPGRSEDLAGASVSIYDAATDFLGKAGSGLHSPTLSRVNSLRCFSWDAGVAKGNGLSYRRTMKRLCYLLALLLYLAILLTWVFWRSQRAHDISELLHHGNFSGLAWRVILWLALSALLFMPVAAISGLISKPPVKKGASIFSLSTLFAAVLSLSILLAIRGFAISMDVNRSLGSVSLNVIGCLVALWLTTRWHCGWRALGRSVLTFAVLIVFLGAGTIAVGCYLVDSTPVLPPVQAPDEHELGRINATLHQTRRNNPQVPAQIRLNERDLQILMDSICTTKLKNFRSSIDIRAAAVAVRVSIPISAEKDTSFVNVEIDGQPSCNSGEIEFRVTEFGVAGSTFPTQLAQVIVNEVLKSIEHDRVLLGVLRRIQDLKIRENSLSLRVLTSGEARLPSQITEPPSKPVEVFQGVTYERLLLEAPDGNYANAHIVEVDLTEEGIGIYVRPAIVPGTGEYVLEDLETIMRRESLAVAVNGPMFGLVSNLSLPVVGAKARSAETIISNGVMQYYDRKSRLIWFDADQRPHFEKFAPTPNDVLQSAVCGIGSRRTVLVADGHPTKLALQSPNDRRTAVGIDKKGQRMWLAVFDYADHMLVARTMHELGATHAISCDGGGSTAMRIAPSTALRKGLVDPGDYPVATLIGVRARSIDAR